MKSHGKFNYSSECKYGVPIKNLVESIHVGDANTPVSEIKKLIGEDEPIRAVAVISEKKPIGLVMSLHLDKTLSHRFGLALYYDKPVSNVMDSSPLIVEGDTPLAVVADMAMNREKTKIYDHIIVLCQGEFAGIVSVQNILNTMVDIQEANTQELNRINEQLRKEVDDRKKAEYQLIQSNKKLGDRVSERTAELQESNEKLRRAVDVAEAANRAKSDFLANMSHELRTPLNHIIGFNELVLEQHFGQLNEIQIEYLTDVLNSSKHLLSLINDILDLSKIEAGKLGLRSSEIDLKNLLEKSLLMIKEKALKHSIKLDTEIQDIPDFIEADERKLKQILYNLLSNSVKFTSDGGNIRLIAKTYTGNSGFQKYESSEMNAGHNGDLLEIAVTDTGIGLKKEDRDHIFDPFIQADSSRARRYQETGLGLSITKQLVELHGGKIWAESDGEGKGATFRFVIPSRQRESEIQSNLAVCSL